MKYKGKYCSYWNNNFKNQWLKMKISTLLLFIVLLPLSANTLSQTINFDKEFKGSTFSEFMEFVEQKTDYKFFLSNSEVDVDKQVVESIGEITVEKAIGVVLTELQLDYKITDENLILIVGNTNSEGVQQQDQKITGIVSEESGAPIPGVSVVVKGTTNGTITDLDGKYYLDAPKGTTLVFTFIGMVSQEVVVDNDVVNVTLQSDVIGLEEVIAIGYGTIKTADVTSSVSTVKSEEFTAGSVQDAGQLIQGKVAGLTLNTTSGDPTASTSISLRGNTTLFGTSTSPLVLVDGIPSDMGTVAPEDIESIDILKDGSAAAIYGTRGTNGVIIITTKRASGDYSSHVEYSGYVTTQAISNSLDMLSAADYRQQIADGIRAQSDDLGANTDWQDEITQAPVNHVHNLTFRGGNSTTNYLATINYRDIDGIFLDSYSEKLTARADINHSMFDGLLSVNLGMLTKTVKEFGFNGYTYRQAIIYNPTSPIKDENGVWVEQPGAFNYDNPVARIEESDGETSTNLSRFNGSLNLKPVSGLNIKGVFSFSKWNSTYGYYETSKHISTVRGSLNGYATNNAVENVEKLLDITAEYKTNIGEHNFTVLGGYSYQDFVGRSFYVNNNDFPTDMFGYNNIGIGTGIKEGSTSWGIGSGKTKTNLIGFFGRLNYNYKNRYLLMASVRHEAASQLYGTKDPWGTFPSISVGWRITEEPFMSGVEFLDNLKLRAGYGVTGTQPSNLFLGVATLGYGEYFYNDGKWIQTLAPARNSNEYLRWEEKKETNIGLDFGLFNNRITGTVDYYNRRIDGLLYDYAVPTPPNLVSTTRANAGEMENEGIEVLLSGTPVKNSDFEWNTGITFSTNSNKLISLSSDEYEATTDYFTTGGTGEPIQTFTHRVDVGGPIGNFYGFKVVDVDSDGKWIYEDAAGNEVPYDEFEHSFENKKVLGNGIPKFQAGWQNNFKYKNWDLSVTMRGAFDYQILNFERMYLENTKNCAI